MPTLPEVLQAIKDEPHRLGWLLGYKALTEIHSRWIRMVWGAARDNTLMAHRGSYKTTAITVVGTIWWLLFYPDHRVLICSSTDGNAARILGEIATHYRGEALRALYAALGCAEPRGPEWRNDSITLSTRRQVRKEGSVECVGAGGTVTSRHYDRIICDDLVTLRDRYSAAAREQKKGWVRELQSIIDPGGIIGYVGTPWHKDDVYAILPEPARFPLGSVQIAGLTDTKVAEIRRLQGESFFSAQYLLKHVSDGDRIFDSPTFGEAPEGLRVYGYLDPAFGGADASALVIGGDDLVMGEGNAVLAGGIHVIYGGLNASKPDEMLDWAVATCREFGAELLFVEANAAQTLVADEIERRGQACRRVHTTANKYLRICSALRPFWQAIRFGPAVAADFIDQVCEYNEFASHDDAPDSLAGLVHALRGGNGSARAIEAPLWG